MSAAVGPVPVPPGRDRPGTRGLYLSRNLLLALVTAFLYLPILVLIVYSVNDSRFAATWKGFSLRWYLKLFHDPELGPALENTLIVASASTLISTVLGSALALGLRFHRVPGRRLLGAVLQLPIVFPEIVMALSLLAAFVVLGVPLGLSTIVLAHVSFQISFVWMVVDGALQGFPLETLEAARDLGADRWKALSRVVLPMIWPAIVAGALIAFTLSIDDFVMAYFTQGSGSATLAVRIYSMVKRGVTPDINALCALLLLFTTFTMLIAERLLSSDRTSARGRGPGAGRVMAGMLLAAALVVMAGWALRGRGAAPGEGTEAGADALVAHGRTWSRQALGSRLNFFIYPDYMDPEVIQEFETTYGVKVVIDYYDTNEALLAKLQAGGVGLYDVVVPSGYGITVLRKQDLLEPLDLDKLPNLEHLMPRFLDPPFDPGNRYTVCYMWGTTGLGVRKDRLPPGTPLPDSWAVLFDPAASLGPFSMIDDQRETIGTTLKYLGHPINSVDPAHLRQAEELLIQQRRRALTWASSSTSRDLLSSGDVVVQMNYSGDIALAASENPEVAYVIPKEGASIWTDNLALAKQAPHREAAHAFLNFLLDPGVAARLANFTKYATPNQTALADVDPTLRDDPALYPPPEVQRRLEFVVDVGEATRLYAETWVRVKASGG